MTEKQFGQECAKRGFAKLAPHFYARCYGDGLYQFIYTGFRQYYSWEHIQEHPKYANKQSNYLTIGIRSLYWNWAESFFVPGRDSGDFTPWNLKYDASKRPIVFRGIESEYSYMEEIGFDLLDQITTQEAYLKLYNSKIIDRAGNRVHNTALIASYLMCRDCYEAQIEIAHNFTHRMVYRLDMVERLLCEEHKEEYTRQIREVRERLGTVVFLWNAIMGRNDYEIRAFLRNNYERNMAWIQKYGIPHHPNFQPAEIPTDFSL